MGCDIHTFAQKRENGVWVDIPEVGFADRNYGAFAFLAGVRNYAGITPIVSQRGLPDDFEGDEGDRWPGDHSFSWLSLDELLAFDYEAMMEDRRVTRRLPSGIISGGETCEPGQGVAQTYREFLGPWFFKDLAAMQAAGAERIVFGFDS